MAALKKVAILFPSFGNELTGKERVFIQNSGFNYEKYISETGKFLQRDLSFDDIFTNAPDELDAQLFAYTLSNVMSGVLSSNDITASCVAGLSSGLYAALRYAGAFSFYDGLRIIDKAFWLIKEKSSSKKFLMGGIIGLNTKEVEQAIYSENFNAEIINITGEFTVVIAGEKDDVEKVLNLCKTEGALSVKHLPIYAPYHTKYAKDIKEEFEEFVNSIVMRDLTTPLISTVNTRALLQKNDVKKEIVANLIKRIDWNLAMRRMINNGEKYFFECGGGRSLTKLAKFFEEDFKIYNAENIKLILDA